jgi:hypothetical protein
MQPEIVLILLHLHFILMFEVDHAHLGGAGGLGFGCPTHMTSGRGNMASLVWTYDKYMFKDSKNTTCGDSFFLSCLYVDW